MKNLIILGLLFFAACTKNDKVISETENQTKEKQRCDFGLTQFNLAKRSPVLDEFANKNPRGGGSGGGGGIQPPATSAGVVFLDFDGQVVSGTGWNYNGTITCAPANLASNAVATIFDRVSNDYSPFNITVTTDENVYNAANIYKRIRVIITETWEWFGQAGGASFLNSFTDGSNTPSFVFSSLLNYNIKNIGEAVSHEAGHSLNLQHQSTYDAGGVKTSEYNYGIGSGETGWSPIMGCSYYQNLSLWHKGANAISASTIQDDAAIIAAVVGYKTDDYSNTTSNAVSLTNTISGMRNNSTDIDFFSVNISTTKTVLLTPFNVGAGNLGANEDLILKIYNAQGSLLSTIDNPLTLDASAILAPGIYYVSVSAIANPFTTTYGMLGKYTISLN
ncbi:MAG: hypothetical protein SGI83_08560 [Bacteroidota bacterium]|nr:hypothetical protein [Bacteroidota bacterium]